MTLGDTRPRSKTHGERFLQLYENLSDEKKQAEFLAAIAAETDRIEAEDREASEGPEKVATAVHFKGFVQEKGLNFQFP